MRAGFIPRRSTNSRANPKNIKDEGYKAMKLRFGWGPTDGAEGMQKNLALVRTVRETVGDGVDIMADAYMGWNLDYAKRMIPLLEKFNLRWLEEPVIPDDIHGYAELKKFGRIPIAGGEHEYTLYGFRELIESHCVDYIQFDTNRVGGISQARKIAALAEAHSIPVIPHAGQMHNYHIVMASLNSPMAEFFPPVDVEVGNELFWYCFNGEPTPKNGFIDLDENTPGLGLTVNEEKLKKFRGHRMTRLVQIQNGKTRAVALVDEPRLRLLDGVESIFRARAICGCHRARRCSSWCSRTRHRQRAWITTKFIPANPNGVCFRRLTIRPNPRAASFPAPASRISAARKIASKCTARAKPS